MTSKKEKKESNLPWKERKSEQEKLVNAINFHGHVLEDRVAEVICVTYRDTLVEILSNVVF